MADAARTFLEPGDAVRSAVAGLVEAGIPAMVLAEAIRDPVAGGADGSPLDQVLILVHPACQAEAVESLIQAGWSLPPEAARERSLGWIAARHMWPLARGQARIDLHHHATVFNRLQNDDDRLWRYSALIPWRGISVRTPRREHALLVAVVQGLCGPTADRAPWLERAGRLLVGPPIEWPELLHDIRLRYLEAIMHTGLARLAAEQAAAVPAEVLARLAAESSPAQRAELTRWTASTVVVSDEDARQNYEIALARYRRRHEFTSPTQAAQAPSATMALDLPPGGATAWIRIPDDRVPTDWLVLKITAELPAAVFDGSTALRLVFPGLPVGAVPVIRPGSGPQQRFTAMLPLHQGFLGARGIDTLGLVFVRDGQPIAWDQPVPVQIDSLMAITGNESVPAVPRAATPSPAQPATGPRIVLCRPRGGLNDTLNQIELCWEYAERYGRRMLVDASRSGLQSPFSNYFRPRDAASNVLLHPSPQDVTAFDLLPAEPPELTGRISTYAVSWDGRYGYCWPDGEHRVPVRFDRERDHAAALLVHEQHGGGTDSLAALRRLRFTDPVAAIIRSRVAALGAGYVGIHVRQTDDPVDADGFLTALRESLAGRRVLVCTDDAAIVARARGILTSSEVFTASKIQDARGRPQHAVDAFPDPAARHRANLDALVDLVALGRADRVVLSRGYSGRHSGFGRLAKLLCEHRDVLAGLLG
jgi:hypothetical protein